MGQIRRIENMLDPVELAASVKTAPRHNRVRMRFEYFVVGFPLAQGLDALMLEGDDAVVDDVDAVMRVAPKNPSRTIGCSPPFLPQPVVRSQGSSRISAIQRQAGVVEPAFPVLFAVALFLLPPDKRLLFARC